jgi:FtsH-binding integral membrane protein
MNPYMNGRVVVATRVMPAFFLSLLVGTAGLLVGSTLPPTMIGILMIAEIVMIFAATFLRRQRSVGFGFVYAFTFISGATLYPLIAYYISANGANIVLEAFAVTVFAYGGAAAYAYFSKADFSFLAGFLFAGLLALIGMGIVGLFVHAYAFYMVYVLLGIAIFIGYTLFDISRIAQYGVRPEDVPLVVLSLYLNFVNLFTFILEFIGLTSQRRN